MFIFKLFQCYVCCILIFVHQSKTFQHWQHLLLWFMMLPLPKPTHPWFWYRVRSQPHHIDGFLSQKVVCREDFPIHFQVFPSWEVTTACNIPRTSKNVADLCFPRIRPDSLQVVNTYRLNCVMRCLSSRLRRSSAVPRHVNMSFRKKKPIWPHFSCCLYRRLQYPLV